jgi:hypothetical protein
MYRIVFSHHSSLQLTLSTHGWLMRNPVSALVDLVLKRVWYVHETTHLTLQATPAACLQAMAIAAKPSVDRLQLRDVFSDGRRYYLEPDENGFRMRCSSGGGWRNRRRGGSASLLFGVFEPIENGITRLNLSAHITVPYLLSVFLAPLMIAVIILPFDLWYDWFRIGIVLLLLGLSWGSHRAQAQLQAVEMVYFIGRALEDFDPVIIPSLGESTPHVADDTLHREFRQEWEKFYKEHERD